MTLPRDPQAGDRVRASDMRRILSHLKGCELHSGPGTRVSRYPKGTVVDILPDKPRKFTPFEFQITRWQRVSGETQPADWRTFVVAPGWVSGSMPFGVNAGMTIETMSPTPTFFAAGPQRIVVPANKKGYTIFIVQPMENACGHMQFGGDGLLQYAEGRTGFKEVFYGPLVLHGDDESVGLADYVYHALAATQVGGEEQWQDLNIGDYVFGHDWKQFAQSDPSANWKQLDHPGYGRGDARLVVGRIDTGSDDEKSFTIHQHVVGNVGVRLPATEEITERLFGEAYATPRAAFVKKPLLYFPEPILAGWPQAPADPSACGCGPCLADPWTDHPEWFRQHDDHVFNPRDPWCGNVLCGIPTYSISAFRYKVSICKEPFNDTASWYLWKCKTYDQVRSDFSEATGWDLEQLDLHNWLERQYVCWRDGQQTGGPFVEGQWYVWWENKQASQALADQAEEMIGPNAEVLLQLMRDLNSGKLLIGFEADEWEPACPGIVLPPTGD
ncbi:MAG: hypothetical protein NT105_23675 [Verrucomicrobia bacterium]|nr:hypothetical protein [Verrucomicrobiota bacterium]